MDIEPTKPVRKKRKPKTRYQKYHKKRPGPKKTKWSTMRRKPGPKPGKPNRFKRKGLDFLPYSIAKIYIQTIPNPPPQTIKEYLSWYKSNKPYFMPYNPRSVYSKEWVSWNDFLGNTNSFEDNYKRKHEYSQRILPFWEAVYLTQKLAKEHGFTTAAGYRTFHKANPTLVSQLPLAPNMFYEKEWIGWPTWLGKKVAQQVLPIQNMEQYFFIVQHDIEYFSFHITTEGKDEARTILSSSPGAKLIKAYVYEESVHGQLERIIEENSEEYEESTRFCSNINDIIYLVDTLLIVFKG